MSVKFLGGRVVWGTWRAPFSGEGLVVEPGSSYNQERNNVHGLLGILKVTHSSYSSSGCVTPAHLPSDAQSCERTVRSRTKEGSATRTGCCTSCSAPQATWSANPLVP